jgi:acyl carrier protein
MTDRQKIVDSLMARVRQIVPEAAEEDLAEDRDLREFAGFDALGILEFLVWLEGEFAMAIPDEELVVENFTTVDKMAAYVTAHQ